MSLLMLDAFEKAYDDSTLKDKDGKPLLDRKGEKIVMTDFYVMPSGQMSAIRRKVRKQRAVVRGLEAKSIERMQRRLLSGVPVNAKEVHLLVDIGLLDPSQLSPAQWMVYLNNNEDATAVENRSILASRIPTAADKYITRMSA